MKKDQIRKKRIFKRICLLTLCLVLGSAGMKGKLSLTAYANAGISPAFVKVESQNKLKSVKKQWPKHLSKKRKKLIEAGVSLVGKTRWESKAWSNRVYKAGKKPKSLCCSSFVSWCFYYSGVDKKIDYDCWKFLTSKYFEQISRDELLPGDIALISKSRRINDVLHRGHVGIYVGKNKLGEDVWLHCTIIGTNGVTLNNDKRFTAKKAVYYRYTKF